MFKLKTIIGLFLIFFISGPLYSGIYRKGVGTIIRGHHIGSTLYLDFLKSYISGYIDMRKRKPVRRSLKTKWSLKDELFFYFNLFKRSFPPSYILLEADLHPLTYLGMYTYKNNQNLYRKGDVKFDDFTLNILQLIGTRYESPYSVSLFLGDIQPFFMADQEKSKKGEKPQIRQSGSALMGLIFTFGNKKLIKLDQRKNLWIETSFKVKGTNITRATKKKWIYEVGYIHHKDPSFFDSITFQITREWATKNSKRFFDNLNFEYIFHLPLENNFRNSFEKFSTFQKLIVGRNFHFKTFVLGLDLGFKWEMYKIAEGRTLSETTVFIAPNISW